MKVRWNIYVKEEVKKRAVEIMRKYPVPKRDGDFITYLILQIPTHLPDAFIALSFQKKKPAKDILQTIIQYIQSEILEKTKYRNENVIYLHEIVECPLKRRYMQRYNAYQRTTPTEITNFLIELGIRFFANAMNYLYAYPISTEVIVDQRKYIILETIDIYNPQEKTAWILDTQPSNSYHKQKTILRAYLIKQITNVKEIKILHISQSKAYETILTENTLRNILTTLNTPIQNTKNILTKLLKIHLKQEAYPLWKNECADCPFNIICPYS